MSVEITIKLGVYEVRTFVPVVGPGVGRGFEETETTHPFAVRGPGVDERHRTLEEAQARLMELTGV